MVVLVLGDTGEERAAAPVDPLDKEIDEPVTMKESILFKLR